MVFCRKSKELWSFPDSLVRREIYSLIASRRGRESPIFPIFLVFLGARGRRSSAEPIPRFPVPVRSIGFAFPWVMCELRHFDSIIGEVRF
jgi:hypothetical protein